jgi:hypothetical protein
VEINNGCGWVSDTEFFLDGCCFSFSASNTAPQETCPEGYFFGRSLLLPSNEERTETALHIVSSRNGEFTGVRGSELVLFNDIPVRAVNHVYFEDGILQGTVNLVLINSRRGWVPEQDISADFHFFGIHRHT